MGHDILEAYPQYATTSRLDQLRETDYGFLDEHDQLYLDFTGAGLAARSQHRTHEARMAGQVFGNPHSVNPTSLAATEAVEQTRARVLQHFNASADEYMVVFTPNASGAAKLVGEAYPFRRGGRLVLTSDNHNSCNGLREFARHGNAKTVYVSGSSETLRIDTSAISAALKPRRRLAGLLPPAPPADRRSGLFVYPAQSNFSGCRHPLEWVALAQSRGYDVLLDAAAYLPTSKLDLSVVKPDFVMASWYKLFGYPTGLGCLVMRRDAAARLARPWFAGGTVLGVSTAVDWHRLTSDESRFEDGTLNFLSIPDIAVGLDWLDEIGMPAIQARVLCLTGYFLDRVLALRHSNGAAMVRIYGPRDLVGRGATVAFSFLDETGEVVDDALVATESSAAGISLRTGCFCNPGAAEMAFGIDAKTLRRAMRSASSGLSGPAAMPAARAIRVSFGLCSNVADVDRFMAFAVDTYQDRAVKPVSPSACERH